MKIRKTKSKNEGIDDYISFSKNFWKDKAEGELFNNVHTGIFVLEYGVRLSN